MSILGRRNYLRKGTEPFGGGRKGQRQEDQKPLWKAAEKAVGRVDGSRWKEIDWS